MNIQYNRGCYRYHEIGIRFKLAYLKDNVFRYEHYWEQQALVIPEVPDYLEERPEDVYRILKEKAESLNSRVID